MAILINVLIKFNANWRGGEKMEYFLLSLLVFFGLFMTVLFLLIIVCAFCSFYLLLNNDYVCRYLQNRKYGRVNKFLDFILYFTYNIGGGDDSEGNNEVQRQSP